MSNCAEFLRLYSLCQSARRCMGQNCPDVSEAALRQAQDVDDADSKRPSACHGEGHQCYGCHDCDKVRHLMDGLTAHLSACGINLPAGILSAGPESTNRSE